MSFSSVSSLVLGCVLATAAYAQNAPPADKPAMPAGHPAVGGDAKSSQEQGLPAGHPKLPDNAQSGLPAGHPKLPDKAQSGLPAGHPKLPDNNQPALPAGHPKLPDSNQPALPSGHPTLPGMAAPTTQPMSMTGTITIRAFQSTKDAAPIKAAKATIDCYYNGKVAKSLQATLDDKGQAVLKDISLMPPFLPLVRVVHGGVEFRGIGDAMDPRNASQQIDVPVYESTQTAPAWQVKVRQLLVQQVEDGFRVTDVLILENTTDRAWLGDLQPDGKRITASVALPSNAQKFEAGPALEAMVAKTEDGRAINTMALNPGQSQMSFAYVIPLKDGLAEFTLAAPGAVKNMVMLVPEMDASVSAGGMEFVSAHDMGGGKQRLYKAVDLAAGAKTTIKITPKKVAAGGAAETPIVLKAR